MNDLQELALKLFEIEKNHLLQEKQEYSCAVAIVLTPDRRYYEEAEFDDEDEMDTVYGAIVELAKSRNATAIITINTGREKDVDDETQLKTYWWGQLESENQPRCLFLTISGPGINPLSMSLPFSVKNERVILGKQSEFEPAILNMLPNWP
ncbi:MAG TPA: hypothetical protein VK722_16895 [Candidatus Aquilonibacter sp.]|jgi:hypothetical protein|nr:hypothetical protein [Candidatus Aquilonibacter sp.]